MIDRHHAAAAGAKRAAADHQTRVLYGEIGQYNPKAAKAERKRRKRMGAMEVDEDDGDGNEDFDFDKVSRG